MGALSKREKKTSESIDKFEATEIVLDTEDNGAK